MSWRPGGESGSRRRVAGGGKGCYARCERTQTVLPSSNMEVFADLNKSYFGGAVGSKA